MSDPKLTAMMLDLSRNIEKLTGVVKTNTNTNEELQKSNQNTDKNLNDTITKLGGDLKNLNFKELSKGFGDITKNIKELDFKKIGDDFKGATKSFSEIGKSLGNLKDIPKSFEGITKSFSGIKDLTKDLGGIKDLTKDLGGITKKLGIDLPVEKFKNIGDKVKGVGGKVKDIVSGGFGKKILGAFGEGGPVDKTGSYLVGEKGPEVVKLEEGNKVLPNEKLITADQNLSEKKGPTEKQINRYRNSLLQEDEGYYTMYPDELDSDVNSWIKNNKNKTSISIDKSFLEKEETFTKEDIAKLSSPVKNEAPKIITADEKLSKKEPKIITADEKLSKKDKRKKEKEEDKIAKDKARAEKKEEKLEKNSQIKEGDDDKSKIENNKEGDGKFGRLIGNLKESGKKSLKDVDISKIAEKGSEFLSKNIKIDNPLLKKAADTGIKGSLDKLSKSKIFKTTDTKPSVDNLDGTKLVSDVLPLKKIDSKKIESEEKKSGNAILNETKTPEKIKTNLSESVVNNKGEEAKVKSESTTGQTPNKNETNLSKTDIDDMKSILYRIASLLEGTLMVSSTESPFRPNSKRI